MSPIPNAALEEGHYKTSRNKYEREKKLWKYWDIELCIHANLEIIFGPQLAT